MAPKLPGVQAPHTSGADGSARHYNRGVAASDVTTDAEHPDSPQSEDAGPATRVALARVLDEPLDVAAVLGAVSDPAAGGVDLFVGAVRNHDEGRDVSSLTYTAHPSAERRLREVCAAVAARHDVVRVAAVHRVGALAIGDLAVVVATSAAHRADCFAATRDLIDTLKSEVPIWKEQVFDDGRVEWVGTP